MSEIKSVKFEVEVPIVDGNIPSVIENDSMTLIQLGNAEYILAIKDSVPEVYTDTLKRYFQARFGYGGMVLMRSAGLTTQVVLAEKNQKGYLINLLAEARQGDRIVSSPKVQGLYVPQMIEDHRTDEGEGGFVLMSFAMQVRPCHVCSRLVMPVKDPYIERQAEAVGLVKYGGRHPENSALPVCADCLAQDKVKFTCWLCKQDRPSSHIQESIGDPPDLLCRDCFETVSAKVWDEATDKLTEEHRYDYQ
jgi:hypothetical protein